MAFTDAQIDAALLQAPTTDSVRADLKTAFNTCHTNLLAEVVTQVGRSSDSAQWIAIEEALLEVARQCAVEVADYAG